MTARERIASRVARWSALGSSLLVGIYLAARLRPLAPVWRVTGRTIAALTIVIWYYLTYRIVKKVALEWQR
jgi:hypothetical protein